MSLINKIYLSCAHGMLKGLDRTRKYPFEVQKEVFTTLLKGGADTIFGSEHGFSKISSIQDFQRQVPVRDYNALYPYIERLRFGENYVLWNEKTHFFAKSSGTSSGKSKFIPITHTNLRECHYGGMLRMLANYVQHYPDSRIYSGKSITLGGSVAPDFGGRNFSGDLSAILLRNSPALAELLRIPNKKIAMMHDFHEKVEIICRKYSKANVTNFAGVPSWNLIMLRRVMEYNNVRWLTDVWPNLELFMHGGISFEPYRAQYDAIIPPGSVRYFENYNASEGYFAFQDDPEDKSMLLTLDNGVFYEFTTLKELSDAMENGRPVPTLTVDEVETNVPYAVIISTTAGLWRYLIGDVITFTSLTPHKVVISGRTQLFINAFGEELMIGNANTALAATCKLHNATVSDFTVAPIFMEGESKGAHQWVIEFENAPEDVEAFADTLDEELCACNSDYEAKRTHTMTMERLHLTVVPEGTFYRWMESRGKIGGQNKVPRLYSDRKYVDEILGI
ncbi:MAG TPA: GH3 auxin-responsive promoter family protein [Bacteroidales bacterium]|mgnify:FL=1|jgi:hypothetical protein|nr:GH3 auxin-responsive promoter family protein [Bacteroidales bacterium]